MVRAVSTVAIDFACEKPARHLGEPVEGLRIPRPGAAVLFVSELPVRVVPNVCSRSAGLRLVIFLVRVVIDVNANHPWVFLFDQSLDDWSKFERLHLTA